MNDKMFLTVVIVTATNRVLASIFWIWGIVEFLIYLFKDYPFNWLPVHLFTAATVFAITGTLIQAREMKKLEKEVESRVRKFWNNLN